jgi:hypothetical protein
MHKKLIIEAFKKAKKERKEKGENIPSAVHMAEDLSEFVKSIENFSLGERSFRDYRRDSEALIDNNKDINIKQLRVINGLCKYLGYGNYMDYKVKNPILLDNIKFVGIDDVNEENLTSIKKDISNFLKKNKIIIITSSVIIIIVFIMTSINQQRWMVWDNNQYLEVKFDAKKHNLGQLKIYKEERIKYFRKIEPSCEVEYFDERGDVRIWYGKNLNDKLEIFTSFGLHPRTGKTLKPISKYMVDKYFCSKDK